MTATRPLSTTGVAPAQRSSTRSGSATLLQFEVRPDGASMWCRWCRRERTLVGQDVGAQILLFQEEHFGCDPVLRQL